MPTDARERFITLLRAAVRDGTLARLTLARHRGADATLRNLIVRPVELKGGPRLAFVWRHATRDVTKNLPPGEALGRIEPLIGGDFLDAHLFTPLRTAQLECDPEGTARLRCTASRPLPASSRAHDRPKRHVIASDAPWLGTLGVTGPDGRPREGMAAKYRQIHKFAELLVPLLAEAGLHGPGPESGPLEIVDMGCGKGYLTFAVAALLGARARVRGVEVRQELVDLCNRAANEHGFGGRLAFVEGTIAGTPLGRIDILIALHACDTATDDALAKGIAAGARLLIVAPCCQKELRRQLGSPPVLSGALRHGIFQERQAEFATDALRAMLLEWAGYRTKVFEFVPTEHTAKNLLIAAVRARAPDDSLAPGIREFASFYGIRHQALARQLGFDLSRSEAPGRALPPGEA